MINIYLKNQIGSLLKKLKDSTSRRNKGFIALVSVIIISAVLLLIISSTSISGFFGRFDALASENKRISLGLSESCTNAALLKIAQNYNYKPENDEDYETDKGVPVLIGDDVCYIKEINYSGIETDPFSGIEKKKIATIKTSAQYPIVNGSWSNNEIKASVQNPAYSGTLPPPTCSFSVNDRSINQGQSVIFGWNISGNANSFLITRNINGNHTNVYIDTTIPIEGSSEIPELSDVPPESATYDATISGPGGETQCESPQSVAVLPPPNCADTLMMLDRTGSMSSTDLANEQTAAKKLLDLYKAITFNIPKMSVGRFGISSSNSNAEIQTAGRLNNIYGDDDVGNDTDNDLYDAVEEATTAGGTYTDLSSAILVSDSELNSGRHTLDKDKVLILISDGNTNRPGCSGVDPCATSLSTATIAANNAKTPHGGDNKPTEIFTIHFGDSSGQTFLASLANNSVVDHFMGDTDTGFLSPTRYQQNGTGDSWTNPANAYESGGGLATDSANHKERYYQFNIPSSLTSNSNNSIQGIEIKTDAYVSSNITTDTGYKSPTQNFVDTGGNGNGFELNPTRAYSNDTNSYASNINGTGDRHQYYGYNFGLSADATIKGIEVRTDWWLDSNMGTNDIEVQLSPDGGISWTDTKKQSSETTSDTNSKILGGSDDTWGRNWAISDFNNFRVRIISNSSSSSRDFYLDWIPVKIYYSPGLNSACQLGVDLSWRAGSSSSWSSEQTKTLSNTITPYTFGGSTDKWGSHNWVPSDLTNSNFYVRVHYIDPDPSSNLLCTNGATINLDWLQVKIYYNSNEVDVSAENGDGDHFFIAPTSSDMPEIFDTIGKLVCPAAIPPDPPGPPEPPPSPPPPPSPISINSWDEVINILSP